jgi:hypothetical protein
VKGRTVTITGVPKGRARGKLGLGLIRCGCWLCRPYRIDVAMNGKSVSTYRPHAEVKLTFKKTANV